MVTENSLLQTNRYFNSSNTPNPLKLSNSTGVSIMAELENTEVCWKVKPNSWRDIWSKYCAVNSKKLMIFTCSTKHKTGFLQKFDTFTTEKLKYGHFTEHAEHTRKKYYNYVLQINTDVICCHEKQVGTM
jgi:hypothetical protein